RYNHYEAAFAALLRDRRISHIAVDESRRSYDGAVSIKSLDFIVHGRGGERLVVDIKGRRYPGGRPEKPKHTWECWATREDVDDAQRWAAQFGAGYQAVFIFSYHLIASELYPPRIQPALSINPSHPPANASPGTRETPVAGPEETLWTWQDRRYCLRAIPVVEYAQSMKVRSSKWGTVYLPTQEFRRLARPLSNLLPEVRA
ncbi:MAG TPA: HYExAFE family protein, partial [Gemmatales bacterium]|nr:HYExAFE family protein [Gemmatales bacterium]